ncbi:MAG: D-alanyl-D-alanine carboxypeptidase/D-alanyl-D-alanine endopeptidase [Thiolinea sp.]
MTNIFIPVFLAVLLFGVKAVWAEEANTEAVVIEKSPLPAVELIVREEETQELPEDLLKYLKKKKIAADALGIYVRDVNADLPLLLHDADEPRNPASTMKLLTTWSALKTLGPAWSWDTEAWIRGEIVGDTLEGDLVLKGYGDPFLVYETFWQFVHDIRLKGIRTINGDIIIDNSFFDLPAIDPGAFDNRPSRVYNAPPSALMFNFQATRFMFKPDASRQTVSITTLPPLNDVLLDNQLKLVEGRCRRKHYRPLVRRSSLVSDQVQQNQDADDGGIQTDDVNKVLVKGDYADGCGYRQILRVVSDPDQHVFDAFKVIWRDLGGQIDGGMRSGRIRHDDQRFHVHTSRALGEQVRLINKWSNNVMTRQLLLTLGAKKYGAPATLAKGRMAVLDVLTEQGISTENMVVDNGSGLSRDARLSARQLGLLLHSVWHEPYMPELLNSLPLLGEDGTLARRFRDSAMQGRSRLKTGTLNRVTALAGYMLTRSGKRMVVVMQHNGKKAGSHGRAIQNKVLEWVFEQ